jgi:[pyruvate, water dikinase]-phosphate phosphotransferase / [pyruvate, water dikinase] kinase
MTVTSEAGERVFHLHLVSDSTGETLNSVAKATCAQFSDVKTVEHIHALVRSERHLQRVLKIIESHPGVVLYTMMNSELRQELEDRCREMQLPYTAVLDPVLNVLRAHFGSTETHRPGGQHDMDAAYFRRIDAMNYFMAHDDGQNAQELDQADVVLVGVSRTSKTPTSIYLANRGLRPANIPIVANQPLPVDFDTVTQPLIVGLTASPERLVQIRRNRLLSLKETQETDYINVDSVREETVFARKLFAKYNWPIIDVTRRSIEETAAAILNLYQERKGGEGITL